MPPSHSRTPVALKRRRTEQNLKNKKTKRVRRQTNYHSSSEDESADEHDAPVAEVKPAQQPKLKSAIKAKAPAKKQEQPEPETEESEEEEVEDDEFPEEDLEADAASDEGLDESDAEGSDGDAAESMTGRTKKKRNDPDMFATSMQKILGTKLTTSKRADPILSRSKTAEQASKELIDARLDAKARHKIRDEKKHLLDKGRVKDVMGLESSETSTAAIVEQEKRLKKTAQRGVVKLFNAVRAAQVKGEEAARQSKKTGVVGMGKREDKVTEMSKKGFLDLIAGGGKKTAALAEA
ncbi:uncharacterized protein K452DRAFT_299516 [Aplosporella prunicola CBS 121167]|uniref:Rrp15p-domain-containing protein n=1 Tax=Aplosporella prunicola CBS 121167 TaxID=1176127 RepID=A0A6A6BB20_9PEZI|nr:uncharacterized protein K452DRAFT_299516 [Aplosporella prunicola CBS 121167]KAF2140117.1 hypothetical protein K452DRAFT_299516 [Aplosporella prunicola CBS 121167]